MLGDLASHLVTQSRLTFMLDCPVEMYSKVTAHLASCCWFKIFCRTEWTVKFVATCATLLIFWQLHPFLYGNMHGNHEHRQGALTREFADSYATLLRMRPMPLVPNCWCKTAGLKLQLCSQTRYRLCLWERLFPAVLPKHGTCFQIKLHLF